MEKGEWQMLLVNLNCPYTETHSLSSTFFSVTVSFFILSFPLSLALLLLFSSGKAKHLGCAWDGWLGTPLVLYLNSKAGFFPWSWMLPIHSVQLPTPPTPARSFPSQQPWCSGVEHRWQDWTVEQECAQQLTSDCSSWAKPPGVPGSGSSGDNAAVAGIWEATSLSNSLGRSRWRRGTTKLKFNLGSQLWPVMGDVCIKHASAEQGSWQKLGTHQQPGPPSEAVGAQLSVTHGQCPAWLLLGGRNGTQSPWLCL